MYRFTGTSFWFLVFTFNILRKKSPMYPFLLFENQMTVDHFQPLSLQLYFHVNFHFKCLYRNIFHYCKLSVLSQLVSYPFVLILPFFFFSFKHYFYFYRKRIQIGTFNIRCPFKFQVIYCKLLNPILCFIYLRFRICLFEFKLS